MTDQSKIPLPGQSPDEQQDANSLIERAVRSFDLRDFSPPPVPAELRAKPARPAPARPASEAIIPAPMPAAALAPQPAAEPAPVPVRVAEPVVETMVEPVRFPDVRHAIDRAHLRDQGLIDPEGAVTALHEEFRIIKRQLLLSAADIRRGGAGAAAQRVLVSSPLAGEGKTYCAVNLALSIAAEKENDVLLVDADFAKPSILSTLGLPGGAGLMDALIDPQADVADFVVGTDIPGLSVLPSGNASTLDSEYLNASRTPQVLDRLTQGAPQRIVIFDSPPLLAASPAAELAKHVGQVILVVRADTTTQGAIDDAVDLLSGCSHVELLLNAVSFSPSGRKFGAYYGYKG